MIYQPNQILPAANDLQLEYADHVFGLRGYLPNASAIEPEDGSFTFKEKNVFIGEQIHITGEFPSPPLAAYVDNVSMRVKTFQKPTGMVEISLVAPSDKRFGPVRLVWPSKTLVSTDPIRIVSERLNARQYEAVPGDKLIIGLFPEPPEEVHIGWKEIPEKDITWENCVLQVVVPKDVGEGPILVVTREHVYQGIELFKPIKKP